MDCGQPFGNVNFTGTIEYQQKSGGHLHLTSNDTSPAIGKVSDAPATFSGATDRNGQWQSPFTITAGEFAGAYKITVRTDDLRINPARPTPFQSRPADLTVGFSNLWRFIPSAQDVYLRMVGGDNSIPDNCDSADCNNHRDLNHYARLEMHDFIRQLPNIFHRFVYSTGVLGINDMSLPNGGAFDVAGDWALRYHISHRLGFDVDIDLHTFTSAGALDHDLTAQEIETFAQEVNNRLGGIRVHEPTIHFRLSPAAIDTSLAGGY